MWIALYNPYFTTHKSCFSSFIKIYKNNKRFICSRKLKLASISWNFWGSFLKLVDFLSEPVHFCEKRSKTPRFICPSFIRTRTEKQMSQLVTSLCETNAISFNNEACLENQILSCCGETGERGAQVGKKWGADADNLFQGHYFFFAIRFSIWETLR